MLTKQSCSLVLSVLLPILGSANSTSAAQEFEQGFALYEAGQYEQAIPLLKNALLAEPDNARYHHLLAKSYGREAERSGWFKAMNYAKKTLTHLEEAVRLETNNIDYLDDLMDYYLEAPGFLGGDKDKAAAIQTKIAQLKQTSQ